MTDPRVDFAGPLRDYLAARDVAVDRPTALVPCPWHEDERPSARVKLDDGAFFCDPCGRGGGAVDLVEALEGCDRKTAVKILLGPSRTPGGPRPTSPPRRPAPPPIDLGPLVARARAGVQADWAEPHLGWLSRTWGVTPEVLTDYSIGLEARTLPGGAQTFALVVPSYDEGRLVGVQRYAPRARELGGEEAARFKALTVRGSRPALVGGFRVGPGRAETVVIVGGPGDLLPTAAAVGPDRVVVALQGGEGAWAAPRRPSGAYRGPNAAREIASARPERVVVALDANEADRATPAAVEVLRAVGVEPLVVVWPAWFLADHPKGGPKQFVEDPRGGPAALVALLAAAVPAPVRAAGESPQGEEGEEPALERPVDAPEPAPDQGEGVEEAPDRDVKPDDRDVKPENALARVVAALGGVTPKSPDGDREAAARRAVAELLQCADRVELDVCLRRIREATSVGIRGLSAVLQGLRDEARAARQEARAPGPGPCPSGKPRITLSPRLGELADDGQAAMVGAGVERYDGGAVLVRILQTPGDPPKIDPVRRPVLLEDLSRVADWVKSRRTPDGDEVETLVPPPRDVVEILLERGKWAFPRLRGLASSPILRPDGSVADKPGFDGESGYYLTFEPGGFPEIPDRPTQDDARAALRVLAEPFLEFPTGTRDVATDHNLTAAISLPLTLLARPALGSAPRPLFGIEAPAAGSGKTLLAQTAAVIGTGAPVDLWMEVEDEDECRKRLFAAGLSGRALVVMDNVDSVGGGVLASAITTNRVEDRVLGLSRVASVDVPTIVYTGNNPRADDDMPRRILPIRIDARLERPDQRVGFVRELPGWAVEHRPRLLAAGLTILRAYVVAGRPTPLGADGQRLEAFGSFEGWSGLVRHAIVFAGGADPCLGRAQLRAENDPEVEILAALLSAWHEANGSGPVTARALLGLARTRSERDDPALLDALCGAARARPDQLDAFRVGTALRARANKRAGGFVLERSTDRKGLGVWRSRPEDETEAPGVQLDLPGVQLEPPASSVLTPQGFAGGAGGAGGLFLPSTRENGEISGTGVACVSAPAFISSPSVPPGVENTPGNPRHPRQSTGRPELDSAGGRKTTPGKSRPTPGNGFVEDPDEGLDPPHASGEP